MAPLEFDVLRDALIICALDHGIELPCHAFVSYYSIYGNTFTWNKEAVESALSLIDYMRITGELPLDETGE